MSWTRLRPESERDGCRGEGLVEKATEAFDAGDFRWAAELANHVMLMELKQPLKEGETVPVTLNFEDKAGKKQSIEIKAAVKSLTTPAKEPAHKH